MRFRRPRYALLAAAMSVAGSIVVWALTFKTAPGRWVDNVTLVGFEGLMRPSIEIHANRLVSIADPLPFAFLSGALVCLALARGLPRTALVVTAVLVGANVTTHFLQPALAAPRDWSAVAAVSAASWPSGHTTATMSLVLGLVLVAPPRMRPLAAAAGGLLVVGVVFSILALGFHLPSDVLGGFGVASAWAWLGVAGLWAAEERWPTSARRVATVRLKAALAPSALAATAACLAGVAIFAMRSGEAIAYAEAHTAFVAVAGGIGALGLSLVAALAVLLRRE